MSGLVWRCGHAKTPENTAVNRCRICRRAYDNARKNVRISRAREPRAGRAVSGPVMMGEDPNLTRARMAKCNAEFLRKLWREINMIKRRAV